MVVDSTNGDIIYEVIHPKMSKCCVFVPFINMSPHDLDRLPKMGIQNTISSLRPLNADIDITKTGFVIPSLMFLWDGLMLSLVIMAISDAHVSRWIIHYFEGSTVDLVVS